VDGSDSLCPEGCLLFEMEARDGIDRILATLFLVSVVARSHTNRRGDSDAWDSSSVTYSFACFCGAVAVSQMSMLGISLVNHG
jgi:hypothetical protein